MSLHLLLLSPASNIFLSRIGIQFPSFTQVTRKMEVKIVTWKQNIESLGIMEGESGIN